MRSITETELFGKVTKSDVPVVCFRSSIPLEMAWSTFFFLNSISLCSAWKENTTLESH